MKRAGSTNPAELAAIAAVASQAGRHVSPPMWEQLASPGHVLFEQVSTLWRKARPIGALMAVSVFVGALSFVLPNLVGSTVAKAASAVSGWFHSSGLPAVSRAPVINSIIPHNPVELTDTSSLLTSQEFVAAMKEATAKLQAGQAVDCERGLKVTDQWVSDTNPVPRCRESADKTRLWVWGAVRAGNGFAPTIGVIRKTADGKATFASLDVAGAVKLQGVASVDQHLVPRAIAADFNELKNGGAQ
ncbi:MAG: hypothetical protein ACD_23C00066G0002 [uncultured bacterium]|nr:MAG: hypothetical protein ACD_23C00066G0002 [uncultured bacterium]